MFSKHARETSSSSTDSNEEDVESPPPPRPIPPPNHVVDADLGLGCGGATATSGSAGHQLLFQQCDEEQFEQAVTDKLSFLKEQLTELEALNHPGYIEGRYNLDQIRIRTVRSLNKSRDKERKKIEKDFDKETKLIRKEFEEESKALMDRLIAELEEEKKQIQRERNGITKLSVTSASEDGQHGHHKNAPVAKTTPMKMTPASSVDPYTIRRSLRLNQIEPDINIHPLQSLLPERGRKSKKQVVAYPEPVSPESPPAVYLPPLSPIKQVLIKVQLEESSISSDLKAMCENIQRFKEKTNAEDFKK